MKRILLLLAFVMLSPALFSINLYSGDEYGTVVVYRPVSLIALCATSEVMVNQSVVASIESGQAVRFNLNPGIYLLHIQTGDNTYETTPFDAIKVEVKPHGKTIICIKPVMNEVNRCDFVESFQYENLYKFVTKFKWVDRGSRWSRYF